MRDCTVVVPTWNMGRFLEPLYRSIVDSPLASELAEIIFVCEKSTDGSEEIIARIQKMQGDRPPTVRMVQPAERRGTFMTRYHGAKAAKTEHIFFIDSRLVVPDQTARAVPAIWREYHFVRPHIDIDITKNVYNLYWQRSHETLFRKTYEDFKQITKVNAETFDQYLIGTTSIIVPRDLFVETSERFLNQPLLSDDTFLLKEMSAKHDITAHPEYRMNWEPRDSAYIFLKHLFKRGPGFAEYHIFEHRGVLFYAVMLGALFSVAELALLVMCPLAGLSVLGGALLLMALSTAFMARSVGEFFRMAPLHVGVILAYGFGALYGIYVVAKRKLKSATHQSALPNP